MFGGGWFRENDHYWNGPGGYPISTLNLVSNDPLTPAFRSRLTAAGLTQAQQTSAQGLYATLTGRVSRVTIGGGGRPLDPQTGQYKDYGAYNLNEVQQSGNLFAQDKCEADADPDAELRAAVGHHRRRLRQERRVLEPGVGGGLLGRKNETVGAIFQPGALGGVQNPVFTAKKHAYNTTWKNFSPAIALAWASQSTGILGKILPPGKTVIRAGWSLRYYQEGAQNFWAFASNSGSFFFQQGSLAPDTDGAVGTFTPGSLSLGQALPPYALFPTAWAKTLPASTLTFKLGLLRDEPGHPAAIRGAVELRHPAGADAG